MLPLDTIKPVLCGIIYNATLALFAMNIADSHGWPIAFTLSVASTVLVYLTRQFLNGLSTRVQLLIQVATLGIAVCFTLLNWGKGNYADWFKLIQITATFFAIGMITIWTTSSRINGRVRIQLYLLGTIIGLLLALMVSQIIDTELLPIWWSIVAIMLMGLFLFKGEINHATQDSFERSEYGIDWSQCLHSGMASAAILLIGTWLTEFTQSTTSIWISTLIAYLTGMTIAKSKLKRWHGLLVNALPVSLLIVVFLAISDAIHDVSIVYLTGIATLCLLTLTWGLYSTPINSINSINPTWSRIIGTFSGAFISLIMVESGCSALILFMIMLPIMAYITLRGLLCKTKNENRTNLTDIVVVTGFSLCLVAIHAFLPSNGQWAPILAHWQTIITSRIGLSLGWIPTGAQIDYLVRSIFPCILCFLMVDHARRFAICLGVLIVASLIMS